MDHSINEHPLVIETINAITRSKPVKKDRTISWDVNVVLKALASSDYEPMDSVPFSQVLKKTLFLIALATIKRTGELQALSSRVAFSNSGAILTYLPEFRPKTETRANPIPRSFGIKALTPLVGEDDEERMYCPVRALKWYIYQQKHEGYGKHRNLFRSLRDGRFPMHKNTLSRLLKLTIEEAHNKYQEVDLPAIRIRSYQTRHMGSSLSVAFNDSMKEVLDAGTWRSDTIFTKNYLRDVSYMLDGIYSLGPIVAGGSIIAKH